MPKQTEINEPVGIVVSHGAPSAAVTSLLAFVWGPAPEVDVEASPAVRAA